MKKKLLIIVGAGASVDFGLPSVTEIDSLFDTHAGRLFPLVSDRGSNLYRFCRDAIDAYYGATSRPALRKWVKFEEMLYQLNLLVPYLEDPVRAHGSNALLAPIIFPEILENGRRMHPNGNVMRSMVNELIDILVDHFIDTCEGLITNKAAEIYQLQEFLSALCEEFNIGIVTLNYDNVFTQACPEIYTGFDKSTGKFEPLSVMRREDWNFIYHLHGSVHFAMTGVGNDMHGITWVEKPVKTQAHSSGRNKQDSMEGVAYPTSTIIAGYGKTQQILRQPFRTFYAQVNRLAHEADSLLFLGYGFGDLHLNAVFSEARDRRRPVAVIDFARDDQDPLSFRNDFWSYQLFKTLPGNAHQMSAPGHRAPVSVKELKETNEVEISLDCNYPLAVWYNGLLEACQHPEKIIPHIVK